MSGFLGAAVRAAGQAQSLGSALSGAAGGINQTLAALGSGFQLPFGSTGPVTLGAFVFQGFEVPETIAWGGKQQITIHRLPGGGRVVDAMGPDDRPIAWSGIFLGTGAADRATQLDAMRVAGVSLPLVWNGRSILSVVIESFEPDDRRPEWVPYKITVIPVTRFSAPKPSLLSQIGDDVNQALGFDVMQAAGGVITTAQAAVGGLSALTGGNPAVASAYTAISAASVAVQAGQGAASSAANVAALSSAQTVLVAETADGSVSSTTITTASAAAPAGGIVGAGTDLAGLATQAGVGAQLSAAAGYVGRALANAVAGSV